MADQKKNEKEKIKRKGEMPQCPSRERKSKIKEKREVPPGPT